MRPLWEVSGLSICLILSRLFNAVTSIVYVENGTSLTLKPNIQGKPEDILWTLNGNKVAEHDLTEFLDYGQFKERAEIEVSTGQLKVHHMTSHDSGHYRSVIQINGKLQNSDNEVQVIESVPEPVVTCHRTNISRALLCSVSSRSRVSYAWTGSAQQSGPELQLSGEEEPDSVYTCTVRNEVSQRSSSFSLKHCHTDGPQSYENIILPVALSVIAAVILVIIAPVIYFKRKHEDRIVYLQGSQINRSRSSGTQELSESKTLFVDRHSY
ncbi:SLAM family member 5 [Rhinichthys klamathensis goyatoka]|uniref:SLAM family member 5 n=1 Tax=Rhinichthys klamathensis goyatoka TaxID=3034132 RepID=UPI0024B568E0|nr:SLAM family member 5 [Rhinichthys klamathensis goyatoka]